MSLKRTEESASRCTPTRTFRRSYSTAAPPGKFSKNYRMRSPRRSQRARRAERISRIRHRATEMVGAFRRSLRDGRQDVRQRKFCARNPDDRRLLALPESPRRRPRPRSLNMASASARPRSAPRRRLSAGPRSRDSAPARRREPGGFVAVIEMLAKNLDPASDGDELVLMKVTHIQVRGSREGTPNGLHSPAIRAANRLAKPRGERGERTKML